MSILQASGCYGNGELKFICNSRTLPVSFIGGVADGLCWVLLQSTQCGQAYGKPKGSPYGTFKKSEGFHSANSKRGDGKPLKRLRNQPRRYPESPTREGRI